METKQANIKELIQDSRNFNRHSEYGMSLLEKSVGKFGMGRSILLDKNNRIIAGNGITETAGQLGFDTAVRLSPYIPEFCDTEKINAIRCDKVVVEFLRVNSWIKKWLPMVDFSAYKLHQSGYNHLPLYKKRQLLRKITGFKELTVCEDVSEHYAYWQQAVNTNIEDCCNLKRYED